jgi:hypothetical protein
MKIVLILTEKNKHQRFMEINNIPSGLGKKTVVWYNSTFSYCRDGFEHPIGPSFI